jgi:hypothetical protein
MMKIDYNIFRMVSNNHEEASFLLLQSVFYERLDARIPSSRQIIDLLWVCYELTMPLSP